MARRWISDKNQRRSARYKALHAQLAAEVKASKEPEPSKQDRKRMTSIMIRQQGGP